VAEASPDVVNRPVRRRASRAAGPAAGAEQEAPAPVVVESPKPASVTVTARPARPVAPPPRRRPNRGLVAAVALVVLAVLAGALGGGLGWMVHQQRVEQAQMAREQRFVDTASQTVVNMYSYTPDDIDDSVNRFVNGTSGPLRDMLSQSGNVDNLKAMYRDTQASSEAVITGAALEKVDDIAGNASVLVSTRVTVSDIDGNNKPSQPYRMRIVVHEDDNGNMTAYDLRYPDGGN
jgi:Mce-associated membrane protein